MLKRALLGHVYNMGMNMSMSMTGLVQLRKKQIDVLSMYFTMASVPILYCF